MLSAPHFLFVGHGGYASLGAYARAAGLRELLARAFGPDIEFSTAQAEPEDRGHGGSVHYAEVLSLLHAIRRSDAVVLADDEGFVQDRNPVQIKWHALASKIARLFGKRVVLLLSPGFSPGLKGEAVARRLLRSADLVVATSVEAETRARALGVTRHIEVACDPLFALRLPHQRLTSTNSERPRLALAPVDPNDHPFTTHLVAERSVRYGWPACRQSGLGRNRSSRELERGYADFLQHAVRGSGFSVSLIPSCELSLATCQRIYALLSPDVRYCVSLVPNFEPNMTALALRHARYLITSTYSVAALGLMTATTTASLVTEANHQAHLQLTKCKAALIENAGDESCALAVERLLHSLTFDDEMHKVAQSEVLLDTIAPACDTFVTTLGEWWASPEIFR